MNILVIGCDQVGASLIRDLERIGHDISLIEKDPEQLKRLDAFDDYSFGGTALGQIHAHLAAACDTNFHMLPSLFTLPVRGTPIAR